MAPHESQVREQDATHPDACLARRLVLVEDNPSDVALLRWALREHGIDNNVEVLEHGDVAMEFARLEGVFTDNPSPRAIVLDLNLPGYGGMEILRAIRENSFFSETPVGILSSSDNPDDRLQAMESGADFFLTKPMNLDDLGCLVKVVGDLLADSVAPRISHSRRRSNS